MSANMCPEGYRWSPLNNKYVKATPAPVQRNREDVPFTSSEITYYEAEKPNRINKALLVVALLAIGFIAKPYVQSFYIGFTSGLKGESKEVAVGKVLQHAVTEAAPTLAALEAERAKLVNANLGQMKILADNVGGISAFAKVCSIDYMPMNSALKTYAASNGVAFDALVPALTDGFRKGAVQAGDSVSFCGQVQTEVNKLLSGNFM
jgi:hypothetical protein